MKEEPKYIKSINFDLDYKELKNFKMQTKAYSILKKEFLSVGFYHRQYSGYVSKEKIDSNDMLKILQNIVEKHP